MRRDKLAIISQQNLPLPHLSSSHLSYLAGAGWQTGQLLQPAGSFLISTLLHLFRCSKVHFKIPLSLASELSLRQSSYLAAVTVLSSGWPGGYFCGFVLLKGFRLNWNWNWQAKPEASYKWPQLTNLSDQQA